MSPTPRITIRRMHRGEEERVCRFVRGVFDEFVAPLYSQEGIREFLSYLGEDAMAERAEGEQFVLVAEAGERLIGTIEMVDYGHLSLLFVAGDAQRRGVARRLLNEAIAISRDKVPELREVGVHSSPNAVAAYENLGFRIEGPERVENGIRYVPMKMSLEPPAR